MALLHPAFWPEVRRGGERFTRELADALLSRGHRPRLITSHPGRPRLDVDEGLPVRRHWRPPERWLRRHGFDDYLTHVPFSYLSLCLGEHDVAHALFPTDGLAAVRWAERTGRPAVLSFLGVPNPWRQRWDATRRAVPRCDAVTALSRFAASRLEAVTGAAVRVIPPPVDLARFRPGQRASAPTILFPGDPGQRRKRAELLIGAMRAVRRSRPGARLLVNRPSDPALAARLAEGGPGVELVDARSDEELAELYARAWTVALPSRGEAFGLVLIESMAAGTPVVGTDADAFPEIVDRPSVGRLFSDDRPGDLVRALLEALELAEDPATVRACRDRAADFSPERFADAYEFLYRELLAGR